MRGWRYNAGMKIINDETGTWFVDDVGNRRPSKSAPIQIVPARVTEPLPVKTFVAGEAVNVGKMLKVVNGLAVPCDAVRIEYKRLEDGTFEIQSVSDEAVNVAGIALQSVAKDESVKVAMATNLPSLEELDEMATPPVKEWLDDLGWADYADG